MGSTAPAGPGQPMEYRQGTIKAWNPVTLENTVLVNKTEVYNLPVLGVAEAASFRADITVGLMCVGSSWAILGRYVVPNTADAEDAITLVAQRRETSTVATSESTSSATFVDLTTVGPSVTLIVPASGMIDVTLSAQMEGLAPAMGVQVSGATSIAATTTRSLVFALDTGDSTDELGLNASKLVPFEGLPPGESVTFTAKYRSTGLHTAVFADRSISAQAL